MSPLLQQAHAYAAAEAKQLRSPDAAQAIEVTAEPISLPPPQSPPPSIAGGVVAGSAAQHKPEPEPEPAPEKPTEPAQEAPKTAPPFSGAPADGAAYMSASNTNAIRRPSARGWSRVQISREEAFPPDPRDAPEVVRFTLAPGGRIRRVS